MESPKAPIPAYGASRSTGGVFRGRAQGNTFNMADASAVWNDMNNYTDNPVEPPQKGKIHFYISNLNPAEVDTSQSSFTTTIHDISKYQTMQTLIERGARDYSPIHRPAYCIFIRDKNGWNVAGCFEAIIKHPESAEDYIEWTTDENDKKSIHILGTTYDPSASLPGFSGRLDSSVDSRSVSRSRTGSHRTKQGLRFAWHRYLECSEAIKCAKSMSDSGVWPTDLPSFTEYLIVDVFISKTSWYNNYIKTFEPIDTISAYSLMKA
ncbi:hypothetical protein M413DRAFT_32101 [Hebeloma cylindrosporum]|uniref:Uncharacterized protein n=1 Tax=Hebeloma cylindrosporum TaxID=76867 RepID=A0A0C2Y456_HEBCY|nr:hypothetical protein M413DRAFT_32101 [Hebeloma cylindrosporum h7]